MPQRDTSMPRKTDDSREGGKPGSSALIVRSGSVGGAPRLTHLVLLTALTLVVFWPTIHNGFLLLAFDDAVITDTEAIRALNWPNLKALATDFNQAHYVPATMISLAVDYHFWGANAGGYHLSNIVLHAIAAALVYVMLTAILTPKLAALAAMIFAIHPLQMEAVSLVIQRKTVLSGVGFFLTVICYQRWSSTGRRGWYVASLLAFVLAALAKPVVVTLPLILVLYDYIFVGGRIWWRSKLPYLVVAVLVTGAAIAAHAAVGAVHPPHGGNLLAHLLMMGRVTLEQITALFVPANLSPIYYYPRSLAYAPLNWVAVALILFLSCYATLYRRRRPWSFFCLAWFIVTLAPESNVVPLAQLRADRFLYLPSVAFCVWVAVVAQGLDALPIARSRWRIPALVAAGIFLAVLGLTTYRSAAVWRNDVTAWTRVTERHPWCGMAFLMLGAANLEAGHPAAAKYALSAAAELEPTLARPHLYLARLYAQYGRRREATVALERYLELAPDDPEGLALKAELQEHWNVTR